MRWLLVAGALVRLTAADCDCACCVVTRRMPSEVVNGVAVKCARPAPDLDTCSAEAECKTAADDPILAAAAGGTVDYNRFCFYECRVGAATDFGATCDDLSQAEIDMVANSRGNAEDLASADPPAETQASGGGAGGGAAAASSGGAAGAADTAAEPELDPLAEARKVAAEAARTDARATTAEAKARADVLAVQRAARASEVAAKEATGTVARLRGQVAQAKMHARAAKDAADEVERELASVRNVAHEAAVQVGKEAAAELQGEADASKRQLASMLAAASVPPNPVIPEAVGRAMAPYYAASMRAQGVMGIYSDQAQQMQQASGDMRQQARTISGQANEFQAAGNAGVAGQLMGTAQDLMSKADGMASQASQYQSIASTINDGLPKYENARAAAGARAAYWANPQGAIPPPIA